jgi:CHAT domain-containing protein
MDGVSVPVALNTAQRALMAMTREGVGTWPDANLPDFTTPLKAHLESREKKPFAHPYYWAGFYASGAV